MGWKQKHAKGFIVYQFSMTYVGNVVRRLNTIYHMTKVTWPQAVLDCWASVGLMSI